MTVELHADFTLKSSSVFALFSRRDHAKDVDHDADLCWQLRGAPVFELTPTQWRTIGSASFRKAEFTCALVRHVHDSRKGDQTVEVETDDDGDFLFTTREADGAIECRAAFPGDVGRKICDTIAEALELHASGEKSCSNVTICRK